MCKIDENSHWYGDLTTHQNNILFSDIEGLTLRQAICKVFNTTTKDIKNSPGLYGICCDEINDFNQIVDKSFLFKHITKRPKKMKFTDYFKLWGLNEETFNLTSGFKSIVPFDWNDNS